MNTHHKQLLASVVAFTLCLAVSAQQATLRIDDSKQYQHITGFGGFVCSPQFGYNHMNSAEIKQVWGKNSKLGCNIVRLYLPIGRNSWPQSLSTAKQLKNMGCIIFASPWGQPAEWKTNNSSNAKNEGESEGHLKPENYADYAKYLNDYVLYLRQNGVELDAISIQNEPDWPCSYAGCVWTTAEMCTFLRDYADQIDCKIIAPESIGCSDGFANALNQGNVIGHFDIYGGHQYGDIQSAYKKLGAQGKELWMTEYLINWNENQDTQRNFNWSEDAFNFARSINKCLLNDFNAWIHYAAKRFYGMIGDGQYGTSNGAITRRGYIFGQFSKYITGMTRIGSEWDNGTNKLEGSAYLSQTGDTVVAIVINSGDNSCELTIDLPFYTTLGKRSVTTSSTRYSMTETALNYDSETCRPTVEILASSVTTVLFVKSRERQHSDMAGSTQPFDPIESLERSRSAFGTAYKLTGKTATFDHDNPLISKRTNDIAGHLTLNDRYTTLVMHVNSVSSTMNYSSSATTLYYLNGEGKVASHNYGDLDWSARTNFNILLDLSPATLTDGCTALISLTCNNWTSKLTIQFSDVFLLRNGDYTARLTGAFVEDDSYVMSYTSDPCCTAIDLTGVSQLPTDALPATTNPNAIYYVAANSGLQGNNIVCDGTCASLLLQAGQGDFRVRSSFNAIQASLLCTLAGRRMLILPFTADIPECVAAYTVQFDGTEVTLTPLTDGSIPAHTPVLVEADGTYQFSGSGEVSTPVSAVSDEWHGSYSSIPLYSGDYVLTTEEGQWGFTRLTASDVLPSFDVYFSPQRNDTPAFIPLQTTVVDGMTRTSATDAGTATFNLTGQRVGPGYKGIVIRNGKKYLR